MIIFLLALIDFVFFLTICCGVLCTKSLMTKVMLLEIELILGWRWIIVVLDEVCWLYYWVSDYFFSPFCMNIFTTDADINTPNTTSVSLLFLISFATAICLEWSFPRTKIFMYSFIEFTDHAFLLYHCAKYLCLRESLQV